MAIQTLEELTRAMEASSPQQRIALAQRQEAVLRKFSLPVICPEVDLARVEAAMSLDKKAVGSSLRWVLLEEVGRAVTRTDVPQELAQRVLRELAR